ncbi:hypothetical protein [Microbacterium sp.]|uniref:hypothetical protein n=1 Tax=Microbacterium sp. TaxID=51671 RepID=UPI0032218FD5
MKLADVLRMMLRRWYIVVPGILLAIASAVGAWNVVQPEYERQGSQIVLPGMSSLPEGATNPYLYLSGLALPTDIVAQAVMGQNVLNDVLEKYPDATVEVARTGTSAPIITVTVTARSDADAEKLLATMMDRTVSTLESMQVAEGIEEGYRLSITTLAVDAESRPIQRTRMLLTGGAALGVLVVMLSLAALVDGLSTRRRRVAGRRAGEAASAPSDDTTSDAADDDVPETHDDTVPSALDGTSVRSERGSG